MCCRAQVEGLRSCVAERKKAGMSNGTINRDLDVLRGVLKRAKLWYVMAEEVRPLPLRHNVGRALSHDEKLRLLRLAASKPEWQNARLAALLALNTTMRACEIRGLRWRDVGLMERVLTVRRSTTKTDAGAQQHNLQTQTDIGRIYFDVVATPQSTFEARLHQAEQGNILAVSGKPGAWTLLRFADAEWMCARKESFSSSFQ